MLGEMLRKRRGHGVSDEEEEAYCIGFRDACEAMRSDEVYYNVANAKTGLGHAITAASEYIERYEN